MMNWRWPWTLQIEIERMDGEIQQLQRDLALLRREVEGDARKLTVASKDLKAAIQTAASSSDTFIKGA